MSSEAVRDIVFGPAADDGTPPPDPMAAMPISRISQPIEIARVVAFLASAEASYCTGAEFVVDGGWTAKPPF
jgi:3alpha(or 20beta)-hydroxysteroid dehydrogenase